MLAGDHSWILHYSWLGLLSLWSPRSSRAKEALSPCRTSLVGELTLRLVSGWSRQHPSIHYAVSWGASNVASTHSIYIAIVTVLDAKIEDLILKILVMRGLVLIFNCTGRVKTTCCTHDSNVISLLSVRRRQHAIILLSHIQLFSFCDVGIYSEWSAESSAMVSAESWDRCNWDATKTD